MLAGQHGVPVANVRLGVVYGLGPLMKHDPRFLTVPNLFCLRTVAGEPLTVHAGANRPIGFLHLDDAVRALRLSAEVARARGAGAWAINAVSEVLGVGEVAAIVEREANARGLSPRIEGAGPLTGPRWSVASSLDAAGFRPTRTMGESLGEVLDYYARRQRQESGPPDCGHSGRCSRMRSFTSGRPIVRIGRGTASTGHSSTSRSRWSGPSRCWTSTGVDRAVLVPPLVSGFNNDTANAYALEAAAAYPDRFAVMGRFDPRPPDARERLEALARSARDARRAALAGGAAGAAAAGGGRARLVLAGGRAAGRGRLLPAPGSSPRTSRPSPSGTRTCGSPATTWRSAADGRSPEALAAHVDLLKVLVPHQHVVHHDLVALGLVAAGVSVRRPPRFDPPDLRPVRGLDGWPGRRTTRRRGVGWATPSPIRMLRDFVGAGAAGPDGRRARRDLQRHHQPGLAMVTPDA